MSVVNLNTYKRVKEAKQGSPSYSASRFWNMNLKQTSQTVPKNIEQKYCKLRKNCGERKACKPVLQKAPK